MIGLCGQSICRLLQPEWGAGALIVALAMFTRLEHAASSVTPYFPLTYNVRLNQLTQIVTSFYLFIYRSWLLWFFRSGRHPDNRHRERGTDMAWLGSRRCVFDICIFLLLGILAPPL